MTKNNLFQTVSIIMLLIITLSCVSENHEIIKDEDGNVRLKCELKNGIRHGKCYHYYPSGAVQVISNWVEGVKDGESIEYFENGKIKETAMWEDDKLHGELLRYSDNGYIHNIMGFVSGRPHGLWQQYSSGHPRRATQYVLVKEDQSYANQWWTYDFFGDVKKEQSHYYSIYSEIGDSIKVGETGEFIIKLEAPLLGEYMKLVTGDFDKRFNPIDPAKLDTIDCVGFECTVKFKFDEKGVHFVQGIILDGGIGEDVREIYFMRAALVY